MSFTAAQWLWLLAALPVLALLEWRAARRGDAALQRLVGARRDQVLLGQRRSGQRRLGIALRLAAFALLAIGAAGPEWGTQVVRRSASGSDVVLAIDVSTSMDVRDVAPSRLEEARREALAVLDRLEGSRIGVVAFAGDAVRLCPLTLDRAAVRLVLESITSFSVSQPGTDLGRGLRMAMKVLPGGRRSEQIIVLWTDGEDLEQGATGAIEDAARGGYRVLAVGVGTPAGDVVPVLDDQGRSVDVKRDETGAVVKSRLDENLLRTLARRTRGAYFAAARPGGELPRLLGALAGVARGARGTRLVERPVPRFPWLALGAILLIAFDLGRVHRRVPVDEPAPEVAKAAAAAAKKPRRSSRKRRRAAAAAAALLLALVTGEARAQSDWAKGDRAFREQRFGAAESLYARRARQAGVKTPPELRVNLGTARALAGRGPAAESLLADLAKGGGAAGTTAAYNLGTLEARRGAYDAALQSLRRSLELHPDDPDARYNYELALQRREEQRRRQQGQPPPQPSPSTPSPQSQDQQAQAAPQPPPGSPPVPQNQPEAEPPRGGQAMDRRTAEQLLGSLSELERLEQQRLRKVRVVRERRGRDW